jgi:hypothetical protein
VEERVYANINGKEVNVKIVGEEVSVYIKEEVGVKSAEEKVYANING